MGGYSTDRDCFINHLWQLDGNLVVELPNFLYIGAFLLQLVKSTKYFGKSKLKSKRIMEFPKKILLPRITAILTHKHNAKECCFNNHTRAGNSNCKKSQRCQFSCPGGINTQRFSNLTDIASSNVLIYFLFNLLKCLIINT